MVRIKISKAKAEEWMGWERAAQTRFGVSQIQGCDMGEDKGFGAEVTKSSKLLCNLQPECISLKNH